MSRRTPVELHDVNDAEAFVRATITKGNLRLTPDELAELVAEGMVILCDLAAKYEPRRAGYEQDGTFAGYAARFLPLRLSDAWHRMNPGHRFVTDPKTKVRRWVYDDAPVSLDQVTEESGDNVRALHAEDQADSDIAADLRPLLEEQAKHEVDMTIKVGELLAEGRPPGEVIAELGIRQVEYAECFERLARVAHRIEVAA
jgi:hypothetical protein